MRVKRQEKKENAAKFPPRRFSPMNQTNQTSPIGANFIIPKDAKKSRTFFQKDSSMYFAIKYLSI